VPAPLLSTLNILRQRPKRIFPKRSVGTDPFVRFAQGLAYQRTAMNPAVNVARQQTCTLEYLEMFRYRWKRHFEWLSEFGYHRWPLGQPRDKGASRPIRKCIEQQIELIVN
jgi:hypothetical protein